MIKLYSTNSCPWCTKAKDYLKSQDIDFEELNVQEDMLAREEMINKSHQMSVPVLDVNNKIIIGFDKSAIFDAINNI